MLRADSTTVSTARGWRKGSKGHIFPTGANMNIQDFTASPAVWRNRGYHALAMLGGTTIIVAVDIVVAWFLLPHFRQAVRPLIAFMTGQDLYS